MIVPGRYNGPPVSANGGYACGLVAGLLGGVAEVTLRVPPPLERELDVVRNDGRVEIRDGETLVAEAEPVELDLDVPAPVSLEAAAEASTRYEGFIHHAYNTCFVCGPERQDGLRVYAGAVEGRPGLLASPWTRGRTWGPSSSGPRSTARAAGPWTTSSARESSWGEWQRRSTGCRPAASRMSCSAGASARTGASAMRARRS